MATIGSLSARILADASGITSGLGLTRTELRVTREAFMQSRTDAEKYQVALDQLAAAKGKGAFSGDEEGYARALAAVREQLDPAAIAARELDQAVGQVTSRLQEQIATAGMSADQIEQYRLRQQGATQAQIDSVAALQQQRAALEAHAAALARGKDVTASMATAEERRAERLREVSSLLQQSAISQETYNRAVREMDAERWKELGTHVRNVAAGIGAVSGAATGALVMAGRDLWATYSEAEDIGAKLKGIMEVNGTAAGGMLAEYSRFANEMQRLTRTEDDAALKMLQVAESLGLSGEPAERAVRNAIALGAATGQDAQAALRMTVGLEQGSTTMITRYIPALKGISDESDKVAKAQEMLGRMFAVAEAEAQTSSGAYVQLTNSLGNLKESFGEFIGEALTPVFGALKSASDALQGVDASTRSTITYVGMAVAGVGALVAAGAGLVAAGGQLTIWYGALTSTALGAKAATIGLTSSIVALEIAAAAAAAGGGYLYGQWLYSMTEAGQTASRVMQDLKDSASGVPSVDLSGQSLGDLEAYAARVESQIQKTKDSIANLESQQGLGNLWQKNKDLIEQQKGSLSGLLELQGRLTKEMQTVRAAAPASDAGDGGLSKKEQAEADKLSAKFDGLRQKLQGQLAGESSMQIELKQMVDQATELGILVGDDAAEIEDMIAKVAQKKEADSLIKSFDDVTKKLQEQIATAGMGANEVERWKLQQQGLSEAQLQVVDALRLQAEGAKQVAEANKTYADTTAKLQEQIATAGMAADEAERYRLAQKGLSAAELEVVKSMQLQADAAKLSEQYRSPAEKMAREQKRLKEMLDANLISQDVYAKAMEEARKKGEKPIKTEYKVDGVQAAIAGSREAAEAIQRDRATLGLQIGADLAQKPAVTAAPPNNLWDMLNATGATAAPPNNLWDMLNATTATAAPPNNLWDMLNATDGPAEPEGDSDSATLTTIAELLRSMVPVASAIAANTGTPIEVHEVTM
jgi:hypothetical protein